MRVKICGIGNREDALWADRCGADYLGVVLTPGFGRSVEPDRAAALVEGTRAVRVAVLVDETVADAREKASAVGAGVLQLHGGEPVEAVAELHAAGYAVWKGVRAGSPEDVARAVTLYGAHVAGFLVEGLRPGVVGGGGAALALDGDVVRAALPPGLDFVLAGGLRPDTVAAAVARYRPDVVDVSSGVESGPGRKDPERVRRFIENARAASARAEEAASGPRGSGSAE